MKRSEYEDKLEEFYRQIKELKNVEIEEDGVLNPRYGDTYWYIDSLGLVNKEILRKCIRDDFRFDIGNVFKTKEQAEFEVNRLKVIAELKQFSRKFKYGLANYYIDYDYTNDTITYMLCYTDFIPTICFESKDVLKKAIEEVGEDRIKKYLFGIEEF